MKAIQFQQFGPAEVLQWVEVPKPLIQSNELLIKVLAAGVNPIDTKIRDGSSFVAQQLPLPSGLGFDVCGIVKRCGSDVKALKIDDIVLGTVGRYDHRSAYAEYCIAKPENIILKPTRLSPVQAAALPIAGLTAWQALHRFGKLQSNERVLIHAAAGGVGHLAVQLAKLTDAYVIATASQKHHSFLNSLNVDEIIDYRQRVFEQVLTDIDLVIDLVGGDTGLRSLDVLTPTGRLVTVPTITRDQILSAAKQRNIQATGMLAEMDLEDLSQLANLLSENKLIINIAKTFPIREATKAHQLLEQKHTQGKIVLTAE